MANGQLRCAGTTNWTCFGRQQILNFYKIIPNLEIEYEIRIKEHYYPGHA